jgi:8-oxo-dGTP diphosphatase
MAGVLRERATFVVIRDNKVLLVRHSSGGFREFAMPGGGIESGESPMSAAARELREETSLEARHVEFLFIWESEIFRHHAFRIEAEGEINIGPEISEFRWWDQKEDLPTFGHVEAILKRL